MAPMMIECAEAVQALDATAVKTERTFANWLHIQFTLLRLRIRLSRFVVPARNIVKNFDKILERKDVLDKRSLDRHFKMLGEVHEDLRPLVSCATESSFVNHFVIRSMFIQLIEVSDKIEDRLEALQLSRHDGFRDLINDRIDEVLSVTTP